MKKKFFFFFFFFFFFNHGYIRNLLLYLFRPETKKQKQKLKEKCGLMAPCW